jgi:hypothetical protein
MAGESARGTGRTIRGEAGVGGSVFLDRLLTGDSFDVESWGVNEGEKAVFVVGGIDVVCAGCMVGG